MGHHWPASLTPFNGVSLACMGMMANIECDLSGDPDQYFQETLYFCDFSGESGPPILPSRSANEAGFKMSQ